MAVASGNNGMVLAGSRCAEGCSFLVFIRVKFVKVSFLSLIQCRRVMSDAKSKIKAQFLSLLESTPFERVTITSISVALGMSRRNIYKHYSSKRDILADIVRDKLELFFDVFEGIYLDNSPEKWDFINERFFDVISENKAIIRELVKDDADKIVLSTLESAIGRALSHVAAINGIAVNDRLFFDIYTQFLASASYASTKTWLFSNEDLSSKKMTCLYHDLFNDGIVAKLKLCEE